MCYNNNIFFYWRLMYKIIDSKHCNDKFVCVNKDINNYNHFIVSIDEIVYLNTKNILITANNNSEDYSMFSELKNSGGNIIFEYNKPYIDFIFSIHGYGVQQNFFFKGTNRALYTNKPLPIDERYLCGKEEINILTRKEIEDFFNKDNYESMYIIDVNGRILFANNKVNGLVIDREIIPSDEEIVQLALRDSIGNYNIVKALNNKDDNNVHYNKAYIPKTIDKIQNLKLYGGFLLHTYCNMLLTVKDGKFDLKWFRVDFIEEDKFKLTTTNISVIEPTVDDLINYAKEEERRLKIIGEEKIKQQNKIEVPVYEEKKTKKKRKWFKNI